MSRWEYLSVKLHEFGSEEGELKRHNEYWVSEYGLLALIQRLGEDGWEATCQIGRDVIMKRPLAELSKDGRAAVEMGHRVAAG